MTTSTPSPELMKIIERLQEDPALAEKVFKELIPQPAATTAVEIAPVDDREPQPKPEEVEYAMVSSALWTAFDALAPRIGSKTAGLYQSGKLLFGACSTALLSYRFFETVPVSEKNTPSDHLVVTAILVMMVADSLSHYRNPAKFIQKFTTAYQLRLKQTTGVRRTVVEEHDAVCDLVARSASLIYGENTPIDDLALVAAIYHSDLVKFVRTIEKASIYYNLRPQGELVDQAGIFEFFVGDALFVMRQPT